LVDAAFLVQLISWRYFSGHLPDPWKRNLVEFLGYYFSVFGCSSLIDSLSFLSHAIDLRGFMARQPKFIHAGGGLEVDNFKLVPASV
jgi:hypothetical protein